ncbi:MAG: carbohydrate ABC transporter permease [Pseudomonadota bacterium]
MTRGGARSAILAGTWSAVTLMLALSAVAPLIYMVSVAFKPAAEVFSMTLLPEAPTWDNFVHVFAELDFLRYLLNTLFVAGSVTVTALVFHSMAAFALARLRFPGRDAIFLAMFATFLVSLPVIIVPLFVMVRWLGLVNSFGGLIIPAIFNAFGIFLLRQYYLSIPREVEEAAQIDGASYLRLWWSVIVPMSRPLLAALAILFFLANWNAFLWPLTITTDQDKWMVQVAISTFRGQYAASWNYIMAASVIVVLPAIILFLAFQGRIMDSIKTGGLK